jgi:hypothetical protein
MFGFGRLASYDYFTHLDRGLKKRFEAAGDPVETFVANVAPTESIPRRAAKLMDLVHGTFLMSGDANVHLVGHSTGGLDARLIASPSARLPVNDEKREWMPHLRSVTTLNTPHYGTPMAAFFATVSGARALYALSALTFVGLSLGAMPLAAASTLVVMVGRLDRASLQLGVLDRATDSLLHLLDEVRGKEVREYLQMILEDQGALIQLAPEAMDLFQAGVENRDGVEYQCVATMAPPPSPQRWARSLLHPWGAISMSLFTALFGLSSRTSERYPCAAHEPDAEHDRLLAKAFGTAPGRRANDGVVPIRSQLWGKLVWTGHADHLDVLGHYDDKASGHVDWLRSGSKFDGPSFEAMLDAIFAGMRK